MTNQNRPISRPWRRFLRFSVRELIVIVLVIGGWLGWIVRSARVQREAVAAIKAAGGLPVYEWENIVRDGEPSREPWAPRWLTDLLGVDYFGHIKETLLADVATDAQVALVAQFDRLERLSLEETRVSDRGLAHLKRLTKLSTLNLRSTQVNDAGLAQLEGLSNLTWLDLSRTRVTDEGLIHLQGLTKLSKLYLDRTRVTDAGLKKLQQALANLKIVR